MLKNIIKRILPKKVTKQLINIGNNLFDGFARKSYSQEGEDLILWVLLRERINRPGFYVDIGAHHPCRFSNTCIFYKKGWYGINVDATPGSMRQFKRLRRRDINLEYGISCEEGEMTFFIFDEPALNTFSEELAREYQEKGRKLIGKHTVATRTLASLLNEYMPAGTEIDFMSIDVEGHELQVLRSNDWRRYRPYILLVESLNIELTRLTDSELYKYLTSLEYEWIAKTFNTLFFRSRI